MGVGGGFILVPAMIYLLKMPTNVVVGTSLYQIMFVTAATTIMQATWNHTVDIVLAILLMVGGVIGAQLGAVAGAKLKGEELRFLMAAWCCWSRSGWPTRCSPTPASSTRSARPSGALIARSLSGASGQRAIKPRA